MTIFYVIFLLITAYYSFRYDGIETYDSKKEHRFWLMCSYLICLTGFSYGLGGDKFTYMEEFEQYPHDFSETDTYIWMQFMDSGQMPLWTITNIVCKVFFDSFYAVQLLESLAINTAVCYIVSKYTHRYFLFLLIYFLSLQYFIFNTEIMREGFSIACMLIGIDGYLNNKKWLFWIALPIAVLFHVSALITLLFPLSKFKISWLTLGIAFLISLFVWKFSDLILTKIITAVLGGKGAMVAKVVLYSMQATNFFGFLRYALTFLVLPFIIMYSVFLAETSEEKKRKLSRLIPFMTTLGIIASSMVGFIRFFNYVQVFYLITLSEFIYLLFSYKEYFFIRTGTLIGTVFFIMLTYFTYNDSTQTYFYQFFYPYTCILDEDKSVYIREVTHTESVAIEIRDDNVRDIE